MSNSVYLVDNGYDPAAHSSSTKAEAVKWIEENCQDEEAVIWHRLTATKVKKLYRVVAVWRSTHWEGQ